MKSFHDIQWDRNPSYSHAQEEWMSHCTTAMVCRWWTNCRKCRHPCAVWETSATWSQLRILPRIVEEHLKLLHPNNVEQAKVEFASLKLSSRNWFKLSRQFQMYSHGKRQLDCKQKACKCSTCLPIECILCSSAQYNKYGSIYNAQHQTLNHALLY